VAASKGRVKVEGVRELQKALRDLSSDAADLKPAHLAVSSMLTPGIAQRTPRRSGALAAGWIPGATKGRARITSKQRYAGVIEYGWPERGIEPARMVRDTVDASSAEILSTYEDELEKLARRIGFDTK
jgi:hypothetical protein